MRLSPQLSILVPTWNSLELLKLCLESLAKHSRLAYQVIVHVNDGADGTLDWVRANDFEYTHSAENVGICKGLNRAAEKAVSSFLVYLNDDMYVLPGWDETLYNAALAMGDSEPAYVSGTMVQRTQMAPSVTLADYGVDPRSFDESRLLNDFEQGKFARADWNGATWPPCGVFRKWWNLIGGYSEDFSPGFYSDVDFSMKLWRLGCRRFQGVGSSLVYHFGEKTTSQVRGIRKKNVKDARLLFLRKWGMLPSTFLRHYLRAGEPYEQLPLVPAWQGERWERIRSGMISAISRVPRLRMAS